MVSKARAKTCGASLPDGRIAKLGLLNAHLVSMEFWVP